MSTKNFILFLTIMICLTFVNAYLNHFGYISFNMENERRKYFYKKTDRKELK